MEAELGEGAVAEAPDRRREGSGEAVVGQVDLGEGGAVAELGRDGAGEGVGGEGEAAEGGELDELSGDGAGEAGGGEVDGEEVEGGVSVEGGVGVDRGGEVVAGEGKACGEDPFEASPLAERDGGVPCGEEWVGVRLRGVGLEGGLDLIQEKVRV